MCDSVSRNTRARPRAATVGEQMFDQGAACAVAAIVDEHLVEYRLRSAGFDRPSPGDHGIPAVRQPHDSVAVVDEQRFEPGTGAGVVERMIVDRAEPCVQRDEVVEIGGSAASDVDHASDAHDRLDLLDQPADEIACATTP